ncbi:MAG: DotG/IcmE/VirB10 family protein [Pseudomonadota bacterium]
MKSLIRAVRFGALFVSGMLCAAGAGMAQQTGVPQTGVPQTTQAAPAAEAYTQDPRDIARIDAQIDSLLAPPSGGFAVQYYAKPASAPAPISQPNQLMPYDPRLQHFVIARPGDTVYATIDRGFNSDDPQAPILATIHDVDQVGVQGPLDNVRVMGNIVYSNSQASLEFNIGYLPDGRAIPIRAMAISEDTARSGVAKNVDTHDLQRYGMLLLGALVQGAGNVGQTLLQNNEQVQVDPNTGLVTASQKVVPYQVGLAAALPAGQALTAVAAQGFNRPPTISGPAGMGIALVFLTPVAVPGDLLYARGR